MRTFLLYLLRVDNGALAELYTRFPERKRRKSYVLKKNNYIINITNPNQT